MTTRRAKTALKTTVRTPVLEKEQADRIAAEISRLREVMPKMKAADKAALDWILKAASAAMLDRLAQPQQAHQIAAE